jgi:hypothetical protein
MSIDKITKQHVLDAVDKIEREGIVLEPSTRFDVVINGKAYPPKEIIRYANLLSLFWMYMRYKVVGISLLCTIINDNATTK